MELVGGLQELRPGVRVLVMTGYDSIASSLVALRAGAVGYLAKPVQRQGDRGGARSAARPVADPGDQPMSADRVRWEHIQRVFEQCDRNVSETARRLTCTAARCSASCPSGRRSSAQPAAITFSDSTRISSVSRALSAENSGVVLIV